MSRFKSEQKIVRFLAITSILLLSACASMESVSLPKDVFVSAKRIGVVSQIGDVLNKQFIGVTVFGNQYERPAIADWRLDLAYEQQLAEAVKSEFGAEPVLLSDSRSEFAEVNSLNGPYSAPAFWGPNFEKVSSVARSSCQKHALDAIVIAAKRKSQDVLRNTNQSIEGIGIYSRRGFTVVHVLSKIGYFDCRSGKTLKVALVLEPATPDKKLTITDRIITATIDGRLIKQFAQWDSSEKEQLAKLIEQISAPAWKATLREFVPAP